MTQIYGIIGHPVEHSLSPVMHNAAYKAESIDAEYRLFDIPSENEEALANFCYETDFNHIAGFSVTMPYKEQVIDYTDHIDPIAKEILSVNTIKNEDSNLNAYNTDSTGAIKAIRELTQIQDKRALVIGAGGAARAIIYALREFGANVYIFNRSKKKAENLAERFKIKTIDFLKIEDGKFDIIVNTTPVGSYPNVKESLIHSRQIKKGAIVMDIITHPLETQLLKEAKKAGAKTISGERMLLHQAVEQFEIWFDKTAPFAVMEKALYDELEKRR